MPLPGEPGPQPAGDAGWEDLAAFTLLAFPGEGASGWVGSEGGQSQESGMDPAL